MITWSLPSLKSYTFSRGNRLSTREFTPRKNGETGKFLWSLTLLIRPEWYSDSCINTFFLGFEALWEYEKGFLEPQMWRYFCLSNVMLLSKPRDDWVVVSSRKLSWDTWGYSNHNKGLKLKINYPIYSTRYKILKTTLKYETAQKKLGNILSTCFSYETDFVKGVNFDVLKFLLRNEAHGEQNKRNHIEIDEWINDLFCFTIVGPVVK